MRRISYLYNFEKNGAVAPKDILPNHIWIDVGNALKDGVFDHHQDGKSLSSFESVVTHLEYYENVKKYMASCEAKPKEIIFHVHSYPDMDCQASVFIIQKMLEHGTMNPKDIFSDETIHRLQEYIAVIDSGRKKDMRGVTLYAYVSRIQQKKQTGIEGHRFVMEKGVQLFNMVAEALERSGEKINLFETPLEQYIDVSQLEDELTPQGTRTRYYEEIRQELELAKKLYHQDKENNKVILTSIKLWNQKERREDMVRAAIWKEKSSGDDGYYYARALDQCMLTVFPQSMKKEGADDQYTRVIISLNPDMEEYKDYSLMPLAEMLEQMEQMEEDVYFEQTGRYRRDHSRPRDISGHFGREPFAVTRDPWYISKTKDIIDAPGVLSLIPYERICSLVQDMSSFIKTADIVRFKTDGNQVEVELEEQYEHTTFINLYEKTRNMIASMDDSVDTDYFFVFLKINPTILRYGNALLKEICLNMVGKSMPNMSVDNVMYLDYRTCVYADQSVTILVTAESTEIALEVLLGKGIYQSKLCKDIKNLLEYRMELRNIGSSLSTKKQDLQEEADRVDKFNMRLVELNIRMEEEGMITNPLEQEVYYFIKRILSIDKLKTSVITSAELLIKNAEQQFEKAEKKRDEQTQVVLAQVSLLAVFSALTDVIALFETLANKTFSGWRDLVQINSFLSFMQLICLGLIVFIGYKAVKALIRH